MLKLKILREENNFSQNQVSKVFNLVRQTYSNYENETRQPPYDLLIEFADYYGVSLDYLLGRTEEKNTLQEPLSDKEEKLLQLFNGLVPAIQDYVLQMIDGLNNISENRKKG